MDIYMVGVYKQGNKIMGFRMLDPNATDVSKRTMDVEYSKVVSVLKSKAANIVNLRLEKDKIKGYNGSLDRYGIMGRTQALVILRRAVDNNDNMLGYICSDCSGNMRLLSEKQVIDFANNIGLANGKVVTDNIGKSYVSAIEGTYQTYKKPTQNNNTTESNNNADRNKNIDEETLGIIEKLKAHNKYKGSYAEKVVSTVEKTNRCTPKQKSYLKRALDEFENKGNTDSKSKELTPTNSDVTQKPVEKQQTVSDKPTAPIGYSTNKEIFTLEMMNNQLYIKKFNNENNIITDLTVPDTLEYKGKIYPVSGISAYAFSNSAIVRIVTGKNIVDIGQSAFARCTKLESIDLSASRHPHIAMNCFAECHNLRHISIGNMVQRIHESAFMNCKALESVNLPDSVETIARTAFLGCMKLTSVASHVTTINDSAFRDCMRLKEFDFSHVNSIGAQAFRNTAFEKLILPGNINSIGSKAFSDVAELKEVELEEGIEVLGEYCFAKSDKVRVGIGHQVITKECVSLESILTCKSIKEIGTDAFRHTELVKVYTGSVSESHCIGFEVPYIRLDGSNLDNSTKVRVKSEIIDANPIITLWTILNTSTEGASNPTITLNESKLVDIEFGKANFDFFHIEETTEQIQPHAKFIGLVNYLQDVSNLYKDPLLTSVLRLQQTYHVKSHEIYNDGCNRAYKVIYYLVDTLEEGGFIMVIMNNHLRYIAKLEIATDVNMSNNIETNVNIPIKKFIHAGDKIGRTSTISGHNGVVIIDDKECNAGELFFNIMSEHCIEIIPQRKDSIWYIPATGLALRLHDKREWEKDNYSQSGKRIARNSQDCLNVLEVMTYEELVGNAKKYRKHSIDSNKFFKGLLSMSDREVQRRISTLSVVEEEKEAQLYHVSKEFIQKLTASRKDLDSATPDDLTIDLVRELSRSYWMIEKDQSWLRVTGKKSLNKTNEYNIDGYKLVEYQSNQVVKFSNPYMNGQKGAYIFTLNKGGTSYGIYASRHSMQQIVNKLIKLTQMKPDTIPMNLMQDAYNIDMCNYDLFYNFYDVLYSKDGWSFKNYINGYHHSIWNLNADFHIAMYKPNGIFYLTMEAFVSTPDKKLTRKTMPVLPIGNMDRALMIATTTNSKNKDSGLLEELMVLATTVILKSKGVTRMPMFKFKDSINVDAYFKARELTMQGIKDIELYKKLVNDRVVYMLGTVHKGILQREHDSNDIEIDVDTPDIEDSELYGEVNDIDIDIDTDIDFDDEYEEDEDTEIDDIEFDIDTDDDTTTSSIKDVDALALQKQLKEAGHNFSLEQIKIMMLQQMK